jgi:hypothetical protein
VAAAIKKAVSVEPNMIIDAIADGSRIARAI